MLVAEILNARRDLAKAVEATEAVKAGKPTKRARRRKPVKPEKMTKTLCHRSATQATIDELRRRGFTVEVEGESPHHPGVLWIRTNVRWNRLRTIAREIHGDQGW